MARHEYIPPQPRGTHVFHVAGPYVTVGELEDVIRDFYYADDNGVTLNQHFVGGVAEIVVRVINAGYWGGVSRIEVTVPC